MASNCCYLCNECPNSFATLADLEDHLLDHRRSKTVDFEPMEDQMVMESSASPTSSISTNFEELLKSNDVSCRLCSRQFADRDQLNVHYTHTHRDKPQYECDICHLVFSVKRELSTHLRIHSGEQPHKCDKCGKEFGTRQLLKKHNMWHTGERSHVCDHCGKAFFQKGHLTQHLMIHKGGRPHKCDLCEKTFIFKFDLNRHMKIHLERGHSCRACQKSFSSSVELDTHNCKKVRSPKRELPSTPLSDFSGSSPFTSAQQSPIAPRLENNFGAMNPINSSNELANQYQMAKLAQLLLAQQQQRALATKQADLQKLQFQLLLQQQQQFGCNLCGQQFDNQQSYLLHCQLQHLMGNEEELQLSGLKTETIHESGASSSCASSPQKASPISMTVADHDHQHQLGCDGCVEMKSKCYSLEKDLNDAQTEVARLKELITRLGPYLAMINSN
ncbi:unnamed protein product [Bursaphelenchus xylophilus]|uniref:(pine wood nematode) hypothetical protein n=1 Tax=Bursaphelenchus xylophilus TaxID=6326 RepID=A0A1I7RMD0_BURXY|nr:unnamed protein product [Bursaphelenchus xylophilus]CAG9118386.1 unnamed protein product [Bursaphelenchus xylophilus]